MAANIRRNGGPSTRTRHSLTLRLFSAALALTFYLTATNIAQAETCTTQSGLSEPERNGLASAARNFAVAVESNDITTLRTTSVAEVQKDLGSLQALLSSTSPRLTGGVLTVEQVYVLDASTTKRNADGSSPDAQFFCSLNRSTMEADFLIPALPPGKYGFAIVNVTPPAGASTFPYRLALLLRQEPLGSPQAQWLLAGFFPKPLTAAGHDGLWYWTQARGYAKQKQQWNAWLDYQAAFMLLRPADFVLSTHLDKLHTEQTAAAPPALSEGISVDAPLVVKAASGAEFHFTSLAIDDSQGQPAVDIAVHLRPDLPTDPTPEVSTDMKHAPKPAAPPDPRKRNSDAASALLAAYPEMRKPFHGVVIYADSPGQQPYLTELPMADIQ